MSVSFGTRSLFKWKLDQGDLSVMDGQCQDEFLRCTDLGLKQEGIT